MAAIVISFLTLPKEAVSALFSLFYICDGEGTIPTPVSGMPALPSHPGLSHVLSFLIQLLCLTCLTGYKHTHLSLILSDVEAGRDPPTTQHIFQTLPFCHLPYKFQHCAKNLSVIMEIFYVCSSNIIATTYKGLLSICNVASITEELLNFTYF